MPTDHFIVMVDSQALQSALTVALLHSRENTPLFGAVSVQSPEDPKWVQYRIASTNQRCDDNGHGGKKETRLRRRV